MLILFLGVNVGDVADVSDVDTASLFGVVCRSACFCEYIKLCFGKVWGKERRQSENWWLVWSSRDGGKEILQIAL
jgi:hypothetical protein